MSEKHRLRKTRANTVINLTSKKQETALMQAIGSVVEQIEAKFPGVKLHHASQWKLSEIVAALRAEFPAVDFHYHHETSGMRPDGGILSLVRSDGNLMPILIAEKKNQGTNDMRAVEGQKKQAKGNAIERLGKNVIGFRAALLTESIFPFVCFGDGCDFAGDSSILDRVTTIAMFGALNKEYLHGQAENRFNRGTFYFREEHWTEDEMTDLCYSLAEKSVYYYFSKYGEEAFRGA